MGAQSFIWDWKNLKFCYFSRLWKKMTADIIRKEIWERETIK
ncbi:hypothetical protein ROSINTL182_06393 [Roseburia intestinalis L1-82]|uniref:Uncharacterized protein n=1 Tax=Roseburia intestinalis L1-82 TaxID=536231 RepID=C7G917_9FIRM|nr:hypothetical protein ROSINTL182_06393 [Roseburia intestinalis L1-82]